MSFIEWARNKKKGIVTEEEERDNSSESKTSSTAAPDSSSTGSSFLEWNRRKRATESLEGWAKSSINLLNEMQSKSSAWSYKDEHRGYSDQISGLLSQASNWRNQYAGNEEAISYINSVVEDLSDSKQRFSKIADSYSKYKTQDEYDTAVRQGGYWQEAQGKGYLDIREELLNLDPTSEKYQWLKSYAPSVLTTDTIDEAITRVDGEVNTITNVLDSWDYWSDIIDRYNKYGYSDGAFPVPEEAILGQIKTQNIFLDRYGSLDGMRSALASSRQELWNLENQKKYGYLNENDDFKAVSSDVATDLPTGLGMFTADSTYYYINDVDGYRMQVTGQTAMGGRGNPDEKYNYMKQDEIDTYNYLYNKEGKAVAEDYLYSLEDALSQRKAGFDFENVYKDNTALELLFGINAGLDQFGSGIKNLFNTTDDYIPSSSTQVLSGMIREDLADDSIPLWYNAKTGKWEDKVFGNSLGQMGYDTITTVTNMAPSILASTAIGLINPTAGAITGNALLGASAAGNAYQQKLNLGYTKEEARTYGILVGSSEALLQYALGGVGALSKNGLTHTILKNLDAVDNVFARFAKTAGGKFLLSASSEALEEGLQAVIEPYLWQAVSGETATVDMQESLYNALLGFVSGGLFEGPGIVVESAVNRDNTSKENTSAGRAIMGMDGGAKSLMRLSQEVAGASTGKSQRNILKQIENVSSKVDKGSTSDRTARKVAGLYNSVKSAIGTQNHADIVKSLTRGENGFSAKEANRIAGALIAFSNGLELTAAQTNLLDSVADNPKVQQALDGVIRNEKSTMGQRNAKLSNFTNDVNAGVIAKATGKSVDEVKAVMEGDVTPTEETAPEITYEVSTDGKTHDFNGNEINIVGVESVEDGKLILKTNDGTIDSSEVQYATEADALIYEAVANLGATPTSAWHMIKAWDESSGVTAEQYAADLKEAYLYGQLNYKAGMAKLNVKSATAFQKGREDAAASVKATAQASTESTVSEKNADKKIIFDGFTYSRVAANEVQRASMDAINIINKLSNLEVHVFKSYEKNGTLYAKINGVERKAPNGFFKDGNKIYIDINAGKDGRGVMLYTMSHEIGHYIAKWNAQDFKAISDFLFEHYGNDVSMFNEIEKQKNKLRESYKRDGNPVPGEAQLTKEAQEELVCDMLSKMMSDQYAYDKLMELKQKDLNLFQKLGMAIKNLLDKLAKTLGIYEEQNTPDFLYAADVKSFGEEAFRQLQDLYIKAFVQADANYASLADMEENTDTIPVESVTKNSYRSLAEAAGFEAVQNDDGTRSFVRDGAKASEVTVEDIENSPIGAFINYSLDKKDITADDAKKQKEMFAKICTMACQTNDFAMTMQFVGSAVFTGMKANADKQYGTTYDFPSICTKTQAVIDAMSARMVKLGRGLNVTEIEKLYQDVFDSGNPVPCPECYVFSRWIGIGGLLDNIKKYQDYYGDMSVEDVAEAYRKMRAEVAQFAEEQGITFGKAKGALTKKFTDEYNKLTEKIEKQENQGEKVKQADRNRLAELEPMMNTVKSMTWLESVYFADSSLKKVNPKFRVPTEVLFDLNNGEAFANQYKAAWAFRTTQGAGYGKAITPYAEARLGEGVLVTNNTTNAIKGKANKTLDNYFLAQKGKLDKKSSAALDKARLKQKIQAFLGGQRFQSTSDARFENASDYLLAALEMQAMGGMVQVYTKVDGAVPAFSAWNFSINQSLMPLGGGLDANGNVKDTSVGGMNRDVAFKNREKHETAGTITIGVNDNHIRAMFTQWVRDFIIPYHASGGKADLVAAFRAIQEGQEKRGHMVRSTDYSRTQGDKVLSDEVLRWQGKTEEEIKRIHQVRDARIAILTRGNPNKEVVRSNRFLSELYDKFNGGEWDGVKVAKSKVESQIFPNEFWDQTVSYEESGKVTRDYLEYCDDLGFLHRFSGTVPSNGMLVPVRGYDENGNRVILTDLAYKYDENGQKTDLVEDFFWKVLTDRRMYDNQGNYLAQKVVTLNETTTDTVTGFAKNNFGRQYNKELSMETAEKIAKKSYSERDTTMYSVRGESTATEELDKQNLEIAKKMDEENVPMENIRLATGWYKQSDGKWRSEFSSKKLKFKPAIESIFENEDGFKELARLRTKRDKSWKKLREFEKTANKKSYSYSVKWLQLYNTPENNEYLALEKSLIEKQKKAKTIKGRLEDIVYFPELFKLYPQLKDVNVVSTGVFKGATVADWDSKSNTIRISKELSKEEALNSLAHEIQHAIQDIEGFEYEWDKSYRDRRNEKEAFDAEARRKMSDEQRIANPPVMFSERDTAPTFYSQMAKVVDGVKQEKLGAASVVSMLRGKGVKAEEIKWSGIEAFLEGKKSVTKAELQEFIAGSMLQVDEVVLDGSTASNVEVKETGFLKNKVEVYVNGKLEDTFTKNRDGMYVSKNNPSKMYGYKDNILRNAKIRAKNEFRSGNNSRWSKYKLEGGENYREIVFTLPGSSFANAAMGVHWGPNAKGVLAHARVQDFTVDGNKMLFIEEIQSDWHNQGHKQGYAPKGEMPVVDPDAETDGVAADAPFRENYHEFVLKSILRQAAENDYDSIGWTTADIQSERWSDEFAEGYRIEYDQDIPKFLKKYGKQWGATVGSTTLNNGNEVWSMDITDAMKESVLTEGQPLYSERVLMGSLFSGGGTLEAGLAYQMLDKEFGVEYDGKIASVYADNHGDHIQVGKVEDFDISKYDDIFYLHASPVCHNFSKAKHGAKELEMDINSAKATAKHLETAMPQVFTVENAPGYRKSESLKIITDKLTELGYKWDVDVYNSADYGSATSRNRVILRAVKDGELPAKPEKQERTNSWDKVTSDLWETLPKSYLRPSFISAIENTRNLPILDADGKVNVNKPLLILTTTSGHTVTYCWEGDICPTLTTKCGEARLVMPDGNIYAVTPEFMGRIQGLPDDYRYPKEKTRAFTIIGNGIPTHLTKAVVGGVLDSAYEQTHDGNVLYQDRTEDSVSNRSLLANAFEGIAKPEEQQKVKEYKEKVSLIDAEEKKLRELNEQIKELSFSKGPRDTKKIRELRDEATMTANRISTYDKQLIRLEASKPLQDVLAREKKMAYDRAKQKGEEAMAAYRLKTEAKQSEILRDYRETKAALKQQTSDTAIIEKEFIRIAKAYEKLEAKASSKSGKDAQAIADLKDALKEESKKHRDDQKMWEREFNRLVREYEYADRSIDRLQDKIEHQRESAKAKVESRKKTAVREKIKNLKAELVRSLSSPTDKKYVPVDLIGAVVDVCNLINDDTDLYKADGSINKAQQKREETKEKLQNLKDEYEKLKSHSDPAYKGEFDDFVYAYLTRLKDNFDGKNLNDMTLEELTEMYKNLRSISGTIMAARKLIGWNESLGVYEVGDAVVDEQREIKASRKNGKRNFFGKANDTALNLSLSPVRNVERMSGYNADSYLLKLFKKFEQGIRKKNMFVMNAYKSFEHLTTGKEYEDAIYKAVGKEYTDINGRKFRVSKMQMMQAVLSFEREQANKSMSHIENGGFNFADIKMLSKGKLKEAISKEYSHRVPAATNLVADFIDVLKDDKWCQDYMDASRKFFNGMAKDAINDTTIILKHRIVAEDKNYIPFESDKDFVAMEISAENNIQQTINAYGMLKDTQDHAPQPLIITGLNNVIDRHIDMVGNVYGLAVEVRNFNKVWNAHSFDKDGNDWTVKSIIGENWGDDGSKLIEQAVQDIQGSRVREKNIFTDVYNKVKSGYIGATFLLNLSVVTKQIGSLYSATSMLRWRDPFRLMGNLIYTMANHKKISAEVDKYTATAWMRRQGVSDAELHTLVTEGKKTWWGRLWAKAPAIVNPTKWISAMDHAVALSLWRYAKIDTAKKTGLKGEELLKATAEFYDEVVENTQSMTDVLHRPEIQKQKNILAETFAMFKTDLYQMAGQLHVTAGRFFANKSKENGMALGRTVYSIAMGAIWGQLMTTLFALLRYKVKPYRDEEDEELTAESWLNRQGFAFAGDIMGYILPIFGSEVVGIFENIKYGESEDIADSLALTLINDLYDSMITIGTSFNEGEMPDLADMKKLTAKVLQVFGVPANNIFRTWEAIELHAKDIANGEFFSFEAGTDRSAKHHIHRVIEAMDEGKIDVATGLYEEAIEELATKKADGGEYGKEEMSEAMSDLKSALGKKYKDGEVSKDLVTEVMKELFEMDEDDIYWTFDQWDYAKENGSSDDYAKYGNFYAAVETGKNLKAVIKEYTDNGVSTDTLKDQIGSHFKSRYKGMTKSERASIKGYLLNAYTALGYERDDAQDKLAEWEFEADYPDLDGKITYTQYKRWQADGKPKGVTIELFTKVAEYRDDGTSNSVKSQDDVEAYIRSVTSDNSKRHALWCCFYKATTSPWR